MRVVGRGDRATSTPRHRAAEGNEGAGPAIHTGMFPSLCLSPTDNRVDGVVVVHAERGEESKRSSRVSGAWSSTR